MTTSTAPLVSMEICAPSRGPRPASSRKNATPVPTIRPPRGAPATLGLDLAPAEMRERLVEEAREIAGIERQLLGALLVERDGVGHLRRRDQVRPAQRDAVDAELCGDRIHHALAHEAAFEAAGRAIGRGRRLVGQAEVAGGAIGADLVGAGEHAHGPPDDARAMGAHIGALVVEEFVVDAEQPPVSVHRGADAVALLARMVGRDQVLAAVLDPFHRTAEALGRDQHQHVFRIELAAHAEAAAGVALVEVDLRRREPEHAHQRVLVPVRHLGGAVQLQHVAGGVVEADGAAGLHRHAGMAADGEIELDHRMGRGERGVDVAEAVAHDERRGVAAVVELAGRVARGQERRQRLDLDLDEIGRILGDIGVLGEHGGDGVADIAHAADRQHRLAIGFDLVGRARGVAEIDRRECRRCRRWSTPRRRPEAAAPPPRRCARSGRGRRRERTTRIWS